MTGRAAFEAVRSSCSADSEAAKLGMNLAAESPEEPDGDLNREGSADVDMVVVVVVVVTVVVDTEVL